VTKRPVLGGLVTALSLGVAACVSTPSAGDGGLAGLAPVLSVERFLQAANAGDLDAMARLFGNVDGSMAERAGGSFSCAFRRLGSWIGLGDACIDRTEIELRMNAIAIVLQHDDYRIRSESSVPGRVSPTTRIGVDIDQGGETFADVGFNVVQSSGGRWLVEEIGLAAVTAGRSLDLDQLPEDAARALRMDERHQMAAGPRTGRGVDQLSAVVAEASQRGGEIGDTVGDVV
jgi:hypothetical protein